MIVDTEQDGKFLIKMLNRFRNEKNMDSKMIARRNKFVVYIKKADQIANFLAVVNASSSMLQFESVRIEKDFINSDNRYQICYNANYQKTLEKATKQVEDINVIEEKLGLNNLSEKEQIICKIRLENIDIPLSQIADILLEEYQVKMSKSSVNRIFISLHEMAVRLGGK
jgi:DNA-binding protein WhiA